MVLHSTYQYDRYVWPEFFNIFGTDWYDEVVIFSTGLTCFTIRVSDTSIVGCIHFDRPVWALVSLVK